MGPLRMVLKRAFSVGTNKEPISQFTAFLSQIRFQLWNLVTDVGNVVLSNILKRKQLPDEDRATRRHDAPERPINFRTLDLDHQP